MANFLDNIKDALDRVVDDIDRSIDNRRQGYSSDRDRERSEGSRRRSSSRNFDPMTARRDAQRKAEADRRKDEQDKQRLLDQQKADIAENQRVVEEEREARFKENLPGAKKRLEKKIAGFGKDPMKSQFVEQLVQQDKVAKDTAADMEAAQRRREQDLLGIRPGSDIETDDLTSFNEKVEEMSDEEFAALPARQKRAIEFNTAILNPLEKDLKASLQVSDVEPAQRKKYLAEVQRLFGKKGGSESYAPNTVRALQNLKLDLKGQDLDAFLNIDKSTVDDEELPLVQPGREYTPLADRSRLQQLISPESSIAPSPGTPVGESLIPNVDRVNMLARAEGLDTAGMGQSNEDAQVRQIVDLLARPDATEEEFLLMTGGEAANADQMLAILKNDPADYSKIKQYAEAVLQSTERMDIELSPNADVTWKTPDEFRKLFGIEGKKGE
jgi:hypothetical protein